MEEYIILRAGYNQAVNDMIEALQSEIETNPVIKDRILRRQRQYLIGNTEYEGFLYKYHDEEHNIGYIVFDDIYELKGVAIFIKDGTYKELEEKELIFVKNNNVVRWSDQFKNKDLINLRYEELLSKWKKI